MAAVTVLWSGINRGCPNFRNEVVSATVVNNADTYTSAEINPILACSVSANYAAAALDNYGITFANNIVTFALGGAAANDDYTISIFG